MQSPRALAGSVVLIAGIIFALASGMIFNAGASEIIHVALGVGFLLFAAAVLDFRTPLPIRVVAGIGIGVLALIFLLQAVADITRSADIASVAYGVLGQSLEKILGYVFLGWCVALAWFDSSGWRRVFGIVVLLIVLGVEVYSYAVTASGGTADVVLRLLYVPVFCWLAVEGARPSVKG
jgi:hypothetical protein